MWAARASGVATAQRYSDSCKRWRLGRDSGGGSLLRQQHLRRRHPPPLQLLAWPAPAHLHPSIHSAFERSSDRQHDALSSTPSTTPTTQDDVAREGRRGALRISCCGAHTATQGQVETLVRSCSERAHRRARSKKRTARPGSEASRRRRSRWCPSRRQPSPTFGRTWPIEGRVGVTRHCH